MLAEHAAPEFMAGLRLLGADAHRIPVLEEASERLQRLTGFEVIGVPGLIPEADFFAHLAERRFPGHGVDAPPRRARLPGRARPVPRFLRPSAHARAHGVREFHPGLRRDRRARARARGAQDAGAAVLVHGRVRPGAHVARPARLRRRHSLLERRDDLRHARPPARRASPSTCSACCAPTT